MEIIIKENQGSPIPNYFDICLMKGNEKITWKSALKFPEIIQEINHIIKHFGLSNQDLVSYKVYDKHWIECDSVSMTVGDFRGI